MASVTTTTASVAPGGRIASATTVLNRGRVSAPSSTLRFYLGRETTLHASDHLLSTTAKVPALGAGQQTAPPIAASLVVPQTLPGGQYFLIACADGLVRVMESDETNNCTAAPTTVTVLGVDLVVDEVAPRVTSVRRGRSMAVVSTVRNQGAVMATVSMTRFYLSTDAVRDGSDRLLTGLQTIGTLKPGAQVRGSITVTVPATTPAGTYFVLACADDLGRVSESVETNNCRASATTINITP